MVKLYVGNLPFNLTEAQLKEAFSVAGEVAGVKIVVDPYDGRSRGFGFVEMADEQGAVAALEKINGTEVGGRPVKIDRAKVQNSDHNGKKSGGSPRPVGY